MVENVGRKVALIVGLVVASIALLLYRPLTSGRSPFPMGLDIAGGERIVYHIPIKEAKEEGKVDKNLSDAEILQETITIIKQRVDPRGNREAVVRKIGVDRIEISLPKIVGSAAANVRSQLAADVAAEATALGLTIKLAGDEKLLAMFPAGGGEVTIDDEGFKYSHRVGDELFVEQRAYRNSASAAHTVGSGIRLVDTDDIKASI